MKKNTNKLIFAVVTSILMVFAMIPAMGFASGDDNDSDIQALAGEAVVTTEGEEAGDETGEPAVVPEKDLQYAEIYGVEPQYRRYNGEGAQQDPTQITVLMAGVELVYGVDYTIEYADNTDVGTATANFVGLGEYAGTSQEVPFEITKMDQEFDAQVEATTIAVGETNVLRFRRAESQAVGIGDVKYELNDVVEEVKRGTEIVPMEFEDDYVYEYIMVKGVKTGTAAVTVTFEGSDVYNGIVKTYAFDVKKTSITSKSITLSKTSYVYSGAAKKPSVTVKVGGKKLTKGTDYTVTYKNNVNAGTAKVVVKGKGKYAGTAEKKFTIKKASQKIDVTVAGSTVTSKTMTSGSTAYIKQKPAKGNVNRGVFTYKTSKAGVATVSRDKYHNATITAHNPGTATITIKAASTANYNATSKTIKITVKGKSTSKVLTEKNVKMTPTKFPYKKGVSQYPTIKVTYSGKTLTYGTDYKYWIPGDCKSKGKKEVHIWGVGAYSGDFKMYYTIY